MVLSSELRGSSKCLSLGSPISKLILVTIAA